MIRIYQNCIDYVRMGLFLLLTRKRLAVGLRPDPLGKLIALTQTPSRNLGVLLLRGGEGGDRDGERIRRGRKGRGGKVRGRGGEGNGIKGKGRGGKGREVKGKGRYNSSMVTMVPSPNP